MKILWLAATALALASASYSPAHSQERTAAGGSETQMTWSALTTQINATNTKLDAITSRVDQSVLCGKKGKIYAPGMAGADADGCIEASSNAGVPLTTITNSISTLSNNLTTTNNNVSSIVNCNKAGQSFNGTSCVATNTKPTCTITSKPASGAYHNSSTDSNGNCSGGAVAVGAPASTAKLCLTVVCN